MVRYSISKRPVLPGCRTRCDRFVHDVAIVRMHAREIGFVGHFHLRRNAE